MMSHTKKIRIAQQKAKTNLHFPNRYFPSSFGYTENLIIKSIEMEKRDVDFEWD